MSEWGGIGGSFDPAADHSIALYRCANGGSLLAPADQLGEIVGSGSAERYCAHAQTGPQIGTWMWGRTFGIGLKWEFGSVLPADLSWITGGNKTLLGVLSAPDYVLPDDGG